MYAVIILSFATPESKQSPSKTRKASVKAKNKASEKPTGSPKVRGERRGRRGRRDKALVLLVYS